MDFGEWVHETRKKYNLDVRAFAEKTGVDGSTISRIENAKTQSTLYTAFRICEGLNVSFSTLIYELKGIHLNGQKSPDETSGQFRESPAIYTSYHFRDTIITINDIEVFIDFFYADMPTCKAGLANHLNRIVANEIADQPENAQKEIFVPEDIDKLLLNSSVYRFELKYPVDLSAQDLLVIYKQGGALTQVDIGVYMRRARSQKKESLERLEDKIKISASVLSRLETGSLDHIKLADILTLDEYLEQEWTIAGMYWEVCKFQEKFLYRQNRLYNDPTSSIERSGDVEFKLASVYITVCRWLYYFGLHRQQLINAKE